MQSLAADPFTDIINTIAAQLYNQKLQSGAIPQALYEQTAETLIKAVFDGISKPPSGGWGYDDPNNKLVAYLRQNIYSFSAAKSLTQMKVFNDMLIGPDGAVRSFKDFRDDVAKTGTLFNKTYLETEYNHAIASAQMAQAWDEFADDDILQFATVGDDRVRPAHAILEGTTGPKTDPVWRRIWPPLDWNCRCKIIPGVAAKVKKHNTAQLVKEAEIPKQFQNNSGITKTIFDGDNTYYHDTFGNEKELAAEVNYGMPSVSKIYADSGLPAIKTLDTKEDANAWWKEKTGTQRGHFDTPDKLGTTIRFDNDFRVHVMEDNKDDRHTIISNVEDIVTDPDEIWSIREKDTLVTTYIKYYDDYPYAVQAEDTRAFTAFGYEKKGGLNEASIKRDRRGILLFRKN